MASSAVAASAPPPKPSGDDIDEGDESEYEEIEEEVEVEEEVEIEEEVETEEEVEIEEEPEEYEEVDMEIETDEEADPAKGDGVNEYGEDLTPVRQVNLQNDQLVYGIRSQIFKDLIDECADGVRVRKC